MPDRSTPPASSLPSSLPIDPLLPEVVASLRAQPALVLEAPPGAGKTTRVPRALLEADGGRGIGPGDILVLEPRRLAARLAAQFVARERGEELGQSVGYSVRFEDVSGPRTRLRFLTEGILTRRLLSDPTLEGVSAVVLDEFHERHLASDLSLAMLRRLQETRRPDLKLVVMSATLEAGPIADFLGGCPRMRAEGRRFEVHIEHLDAPDERKLEERVLAGLKRLERAEGASVPPDGDILVFLPGASEIRRAREHCAAWAEERRLTLCALHADLPPAEQAVALTPSRERKVILSTNVAETSVTIASVAAVLDTGLHRLASHSPWSGLPRVEVTRISKASAIQRAGRAGRTREGRCLRLYTKTDYEQRIAHELPEMKRADLAELVLSLAAAGVTDRAGFPFFESPPPASLGAAEALLQALGALSPDGPLSPLGRRMLRFPVHPRLARLIVEAERQGVGHEGAQLAAILSERELLTDARPGLHGARSARPRHVSARSDVLERLELLSEARRRGASREVQRSLGLDPGAAAAAERAGKQLARTVDAHAPRPPTDAAREQALLSSVLAGFPDRVCMRRRAHGPELVLASGGSATLAETSVVREPALLVALDAEARAGKTLVRSASAIEPEWLLALGDLKESTTLTWNASLERVDALARLEYGKLVLEETRAPAQPSDEASRLLLQAARSAGPGRFGAGEALAALRARLELLQKAIPEAGFPSLEAGAEDAVLALVCEGKTSLAELEGLSLADQLAATLTPEQRRLLATEAPERLTLAGGRSVRVSYEAAKPPFIESRLQDFFGLKAGPRVARGRVPLVLHLLAPNHRAVQVTTDLEGFWSRHYPAVRSELRRRYPRHAWPDDPLTAEPPAPRAKR